MNAVDVVVGVILKEKKFLVERRQPDEHVDPGIVCLPGGHVGKGESLEEALRRELKEELDIKVEDSKFVCQNSHVASNGERQKSHCFLITKFVGTPVCKAAQQIFWEDDLQNLSLDIDRETVIKAREIAEN